MAEIRGMAEYEIPMVEICPVNSNDVIKTSVYEEPPKLPGYSGEEWDPF